MSLHRAIASAAEYEKDLHSGQSIRCYAGNALSSTAAVTILGSSGHAHFLRH